MKRRARLLLAQHECAGQLWPSAMRYAVEERRRRQLEELGVPTLPMLPFYATVYVKAKKWHKEGGLMAPFVKGRLMCPSPMMNDGWVVQAEDGKILHVREAVQPNTEAEDLRRELEDQQAQVRLQLEEEPRPGQPYHRMWGKQPYWMDNHAFLKLEDNRVRLRQQRGGLLLLLQQLWAQLRAQQVLGELLVRPRELETRGPGEL